MGPKKICFYSHLSAGHFNVCVSLASSLLDKYPLDIEIWFIVDKIWQEKISKIDSRFNFGTIDYDNLNQAESVNKIIETLKGTLEMDPIDKLAYIFRLITEDKDLKEIDKKSGQKIIRIKPDFLICDWIFHQPSMTLCSIPYAFICSANPVLFAFDGFPSLGSDARMDEKEKMEKFKQDFAVHKSELQKSLRKDFEKRGIQTLDPDLLIDRPIGNHFSIYSFPSELDYYDEKLKEKYNLWQIDDPLHRARIPKPFQLPDEFAKLPGKIVYVSLGSMFSVYTDLLQRLIDLLDELPYKYIVSKGSNGDQIVFPNKRFIGENYVDQLAVLQIVDGMIAHGGNNTLGECFYFGVPCIIFPILVDQINNGTRVEEKGYGYKLNITRYSKDDLSDRLFKILNDEQIRSKWKNASDRIQREEKMEIVVDKIVDYINKL